MDYSNMYDNLKYNNDILESIIDAQVSEHADLQSGGGSKKCSIEKSDKIFFGSGGSSAIIVITKSKRVYKIMPTFIWSDVILNFGEINKKRLSNEIGILKLLTKNIVDKNISPHFVKLIDSNVCPKAKDLFKECSNYITFLKTKNKSKKCAQYFGGFPIKKLEDKFTTIELEFCPSSCAKFLQNLANESIPNIKIALDRLFFQVCYTIVATQKEYPFFIHYDLFIRNVLGTFESGNKDKYYRYELNNLKYDIPVNGFFVKINDFGLTNLSQEYHDRQLLKSDVQDFYNFVLDVFDGGNLGGDSLTKIFSRIKNKKERTLKLKFLDSYFNTFFNVKKVLELFKFGKQDMDWNWSAIQDDEFKKYVKIKTPKELLESYFFKIFNHNKSHKIKKSYSEK